MNPAEIPDLFSSLKAEHEPWLAQVFVQLQGCEQAINQQSLLIWGGSGIGKSALRLWLAEKVQNNNLVAHWILEPPSDDSLKGTPLFNFAIKQALRACIENLVIHGNLPRHLNNGAESWMLDSLAWFLRKYLPFEPTFYIRSHSATLGTEQAAWYINLLGKPQQEIMAEDASNADLLRLLMFTLKAAGYQSIYLLVDGLEEWGSENNERIQQMLDAILSTIAVFNNAELIFKLFVPEVLRPRFERSAGVSKYRVHELNLAWNVIQLKEMLTRRIELVVGHETSASDFCPDPEFWDWLGKYGAKNPRAWLDLVRPFINYFIQKAAKPLSIDCWHELARNYPPLLHTEDQKVWLAGHEITDITATEFDLLAYLEKNIGKMCSIEEIYYHGMQKVAHIPAKGDAKWSSKDNYRGVVDTALYRLRQKVEANPAQPIYLVTTHGKGVRLFPRGLNNV